MLVSVDGGGPFIQVGAVHRRIHRQADPGRDQPVGGGQMRDELAGVPTVDDLARPVVGGELGKQPVDGANLGEVGICDLRCHRRGRTASQSRRHDRGQGGGTGRVHLGGYRIGRLGGYLIGYIAEHVAGHLAGQVVPLPADKTDQADAERLGRDQAVLAPAEVRVDDDRLVGIAGAEEVGTEKVIDMSSVAVGGRIAQRVRGRKVVRFDLPGAHT